MRVALSPSNAPFNAPTKHTLKLSTSDAAVFSSYWLAFESDEEAGELVARSSTSQKKKKKKKKKKKEKVSLFLWVAKVVVCDV